MAEKIAVVILAGGKGTRMKSKLPKVLHKIGGKSMLEEVLYTANKVNPERVICVTGYGAEKVEAILPENIIPVRQTSQLGTGHAMMQAATALLGFKGHVIVLCGDVPLLTKETLVKLLKKHTKTKAAITVLTAKIDDPTGYGRIVRSKKTNSFCRIVEHKDASAEQKEIDEINSGVYCFAMEILDAYLPKLVPQNKQGEYYLTDVLSLALEDGKKVETVTTLDEAEILGANDRKQLAIIAAIRNSRNLDKLMQLGVSIVDPKNTYIDSGVEIGMDTIIEPGTVIYGKCHIGRDVRIGPYTTLISTDVGDGATVERSVVERGLIKAGAKIGPFSHIRPNTTVCENAIVGNYVELKNTTLGKNTKAGHLSYLGDATIGDNVNIGAGTITCNYDGINKNHTEIKDQAFIGTNTSLVAPVTVGKNAFTGAGSTITKDIPDETLAIGRSKQVNYEGWVKRRKREEF